VVLLGVERTGVRLEGLLERFCDPLFLRQPNQLWRALAHRRVAALVVGERIGGGAAAALLAQSVERFPEQRAHIVLAPGADRALFQELVDADRLYYLATGTVRDHELSSLLEGAVRWHVEGARLTEDHIDAKTEPQIDGEHVRRVLAACDQLGMQTELDEAAKLLARYASDLTPDARAECLLYDQARHVLWKADGPDTDAREQSAASGLVSFVARSGRAVRLEAVGEDPRYDLDADNPTGSPDERFLAVAARVGPDVVAVVVVLRERDSPPFTAREEAVVAHLASHAAPAIARLTVKSALERQVETLKPWTPKRKLFREEALAHASRARGHGDVLEIAPRGLGVAYWILVVLIGGTGFALCVARIHEHARGPAAIRVDSKTDLRAPESGSIRDITVQLGQHVAAGQLVARFDDHQERIELDRIGQEFDLHLLQRLRDPSDIETGETLQSLRAQRDLARARVAHREVRAPHAGSISDIRVQPGQRLEAGETILSIVADASDRQLVALLPGHYRPQLRPGQTLQFEVEGYRYTDVEMRISEVGDSVVGPAEALRYFGPDQSDALTVPGPVVLVWAEADLATFQVDGSHYALHDGMTGTAKVRVRSEAAWLALIPALRRVFRP